MKLSPRVKGSLLVALVGCVFCASLLGARTIKYTGGKPSIGGALLGAVKAEDAMVVRIMVLLGADPSMEVAASGTTPLDWAAMTGNLKIARILLQAGADSNGTKELFGRPLYYAGERQDQEMADLLLMHGADYEFVDALLLGDTEFVETTLTENPVKFEETTYFGKSLFSMAYDLNRLDVARYLLDLGLDPAEAGIATLLNLAKASDRQEWLDLFEPYQSASELYSGHLDTP